MKLDNELVRQILVEVDEHHADSMPLSIAGYTDEAVHEHICVLRNAGYLGPTDSSYACPLETESTQLTSKGHGLLEATRDECAWEKAKRIIGTKGASLSADFRLGVLMGMLTGITRDITS